MEQTHNRHEESSSTTKSDSSSCRRLCRPLMLHTRIRHSPVNGSPFLSSIGDPGVLQGCLAAPSASSRISTLWRVLRSACGCAQDRIEESPQATKTSHSWREAIHRMNASCYSIDRAGIGAAAGIGPFFLVAVPAVDDVWA